MDAFNMAKNIGDCSRSQSGEPETASGG